MGSVGSGCVICSCILVGCWGIWVVVCCGVLMCCWCGVLVREIGVLSGGVCWRCSATVCSVVSMSSRCSLVCASVRWWGVVLW